MSARPTDDISAEAGFSLLETLFALAIMSLASVALFQSTSSMLALSDRAVAAGERTVNGGLDRMAVSGVIDGLLPHWPNEDAFIGTAQQFSGISTGALSRDVLRPEKVALSFVSTGDGRAALFYSSEQAPNGWTLMSGLPESAQFEYMGVDHNWHPAWPLAETPSRGYFDEEKFQPAPALPEAIRARSGDFILWTARVSQAAVLPPSLDLKVGL